MNKTDTINSTNQTLVSRNLQKTLIKYEATTWKEKSMKVELSTHVWMRTKSTHTHPKIKGVY